MTSITVKDLTGNGNEVSFSQDLSEAELNLQGGSQCGLIIRLGRFPIIITTCPNPVPPSYTEA
jgi:hypothetical protein